MSNLCMYVQHKSGLAISDKGLHCGRAHSNTLLLSRHDSSFKCIAIKNWSDKAENDRTNEEIGKCPVTVIVSPV